MYINHRPFVCCFVCHLYRLHRSSLDFCLTFPYFMLDFSRCFFCFVFLIESRLVTTSRRLATSKFNLTFQFQVHLKRTDFTLKQKYCMYNQPSAALTPALLMILFTEFMGIIMRVHVRLNIYWQWVISKSVAEKRIHLRAVFCCSVVLHICKSPPMEKCCSCRVWKQLYTFPATWTRTFLNTTTYKICLTL